jgi:hypothetical protein
MSKDAYLSATVRKVAWYDKSHLTFADTLALVRGEF